MNQRKDYFVKKWMQFKFSLIFIISIIIANTIYGNYIYNKTKEYLDYHLYSSHTKLGNTWEVLSPVFFETSLWAAVILILLFLLIIFIVSKRYSKGFIALSKDIEAMSAGDLLSNLSDEQPREVANLSEDYREVKKLLISNISDSKEAITKLSLTLEKLDDYINKNDRGGVLATIEELEFHYVRLEDNMNQINV